MVDARAEEGEAQSQGNGAVEVEGLRRDVALVVVEGEDGRVAARRGLMKNGVGADRPGRLEAAGAGLRDRGLDGPPLLVAEEAVLAAVGVQASDGELPSAQPQIGRASCRERV